MDRFIGWLTWGSSAYVLSGYPLRYPPARPAAQHAAGLLIQPRAEPQIVFVMARDLSGPAERLTEPGWRWRQAPGELGTALGVEQGLGAHMMLGRDAVQETVFVVPHERQELLT